MWLALDVRPSPGLGQANEVFANERPIVQRGGVEVGAVGPHDRVTLRIQPDLAEELGIRKWAKDLTCQDGPEVDDLRSVVGKHKMECVVTDLLD